MSLPGPAIAGALLTLSCAYSPSWDQVEPDPISAQLASEGMAEAMDHWRRATCLPLRMPHYEFGLPHDPGDQTLAVELEDTIVFFPRNIFAWEWVSVALHEVGHTLGLSHSTEKDPHLMDDYFWNISCVDEEAAAAFQSRYARRARTTCVTRALLAPCEAPGAPVAP